MNDTAEKFESGEQRLGETIVFNPYRNLKKCRRQNKKQFSQITIKANNAGIS